MRDFKEVLRYRIEKALDEGFAKHIPLTSEFLAERLTADLSVIDGELKQLERHQAADIILKRVAADEDMTRGEIQSDFDRWVDEQIGAMRLAAAMLLDPVQHLTPEELRHAHTIQQHEYDKSDIENELELAAEDYIEEFNIDNRPVTEEEIDCMAYELRKLLDKDADACWSHCRAEAVAIVLRRRQRRYIIGRPINGITINGLEYILDDEGDEIIFNSIEEAKEFLLGFDIGEAEIDAQGIVFEEVDE